jgi:hypothetical protein
MNFLSEKKYGVPSQNFGKKNVFCEIGDEITRFDGTKYLATGWDKNSFLYINLLR